MFFSRSENIDPSQQKEETSRKGSSGVDVVFNNDSEVTTSKIFVSSSHTEKKSSVLSSISSLFYGSDNVSDETAAVILTPTKPTTQLSPSSPSSPSPLPPSPPSALSSSLDQTLLHTSSSSGNFSNWISSFFSAHTSPSSSAAVVDGDIKAPSSSSSEPSVFETKIAQDEQKMNPIKFDSEKNPYLSSLSIFFQSFTTPSSSPSPSSSTSFDPSSPPSSLSNLTPALNPSPSSTVSFANLLPSSSSSSVITNPSSNNWPTLSIVGTVGATLFFGGIILSFRTSKSLYKEVNPKSRRRFIKGERKIKKSDYPLVAATFAYASSITTGFFCLAYYFTLKSLGANSTKELTDCLEMKFKGRITPKEEYED